MCQLTPQYGDSFVEYLRLEMLCNGPSRFVDDLKQVRRTARLLPLIGRQYCMHVEPNYGTLWTACSDGDCATAHDILSQAAEQIERELFLCRSVYAKATVRSNAQYRRPPYGWCRDLRC